MGDFIWLLLLLGIANGVPVLATRVVGSRYNAPVDGGLTLADGRRLFGASKTIRGIAASVVVTSIAAHVLGFAWTVGFVVGAGAMVGDLAASWTPPRTSRFWPSYDSVSGIGAGFGGCAARLGSSMSMSG